jgi:hypothetical protein
MASAEDQPQTPTSNLKAGLDEHSDWPIFFATLSKLFPFPVFFSKCPDNPELRQDKKDLNNDRKDVRKDQRDIQRDWHNLNRHS